jgi:hypothetical protein
MKYRILLILAVLMIPSGLSADDDKLKVFYYSYQVLDYYWNAKHCRDIEDVEFKENQFVKGYSQSRDKILQAAKSAYSKQEYQVMRRFFLVTLPKWKASNGPVLLYPCHADKVLFNGKPSWVIVFNWEIDEKVKGSIILGHIMVFMIDIETGKLVGTDSCG